jgi:cytidine deaminase
LIVDLRLLSVLDRRRALAALGVGSAGLFGLAEGERAMSIDGRPSNGAGPSDAGGQSVPLQSFNEKSRQRLQHLLESGFSGQIPASEAHGLAESEGKPVSALMADLLPLAQAYARPPISNYRVGAVARGSSGALYLGANIEFGGQALGFAVHAEQAALSNAYMHNEKGVAAIAVTAAPCGHCRQFMMELSPDGAIEVVIPGKRPASLSVLLPSAFGPKDLGLDHGALPVNEVELSLSGAAANEAVDAALGAARRSWAPYSKSPSGVALQTKSGRVLKGSYIENVAFNPSLPPFETALAALILAGEDRANVVRAVLVEVEGASISQRRVAEAALSAIAPEVRLEVVTARRRT